MTDPSHTVAPTSSAGGSETSFQIFRDTAEGASVLNRFAVNVNTKVATPKKIDPQNVIVHRGDVNGPVIATAASFKGKDGITEIHLTEHETVVPIRHKHHTLPLMHGSTYFRVDGQQYQWKKHQELVERDSGVVLARIQEKAEKDSEGLGTLIVTQEGQKMVDLAVITALIDQERADEGKWKGSNHSMRLLTIRNPRKRSLTSRHNEYSTASLLFSLGIASCM